MSSLPPQSSQNDADRWDAIAQQYAAWLEGASGGIGKVFSRLVTDHLLATLGDVQDKAILDIGCGEGHLARALVERGAHVWGIDAAPHMIELAQAKEGAARITYAMGDMTTALPYDSHRFDLVVCNLVLMNVADIFFPISEVARVLKPDAKFVFSIVHPCFFEALGEWLDLDTPHPALRFKRRYSEPFRSLKHVGGLSSEMAVAHYHYPLHMYVRALLEQGLCLSDWVETSFSREDLQALGGAQELVRYHLAATHLIIGARMFPDLFPRSHAGGQHGS